MNICAQCGGRLTKQSQSADPEFCVRCFRRIDEMSLAQGVRLLLNVSPETQRTAKYKERESFYFMQVFHPERGEKANREIARDIASAKGELK